MTEPDKKPPVKRNTAPTSLRLTPACHAMMDQLAERYEVTRTAAVEIAVRFLLHHLDKADPKGAKADLKSAKKPKQGP